VFDSTVTVLSPDQPIPHQTTGFLVGTFASNDANLTANGTANAARALWSFAQVFFQEFPDYKPNDDRISIWTESYGGRYGPAFTSFFQQQNERILNGSIADRKNKHLIHLDTLGIINGCIDLLTQEESYPIIAFNNTYDLQTINEGIFNSAIEAWSRPDGCRDKIVKCQSLAAKLDPANQGGNMEVNAVCRDATDFCG
jgi:carboxypeptidase C (cathepsin A)